MEIKNQNIRAEVQKTKYLLDKTEKLKLSEHVSMEESTGKKIEK